jgi:iron(II)-dependent oxidoreductase
VPTQHARGQQRSPGRRGPGGLPLSLLLKMLYRLLFVFIFILYLPMSKSDDTNDAVRLTAAAAALPAKSDSAQIFPPVGCTAFACNASTVAAWHAIITNWRDAVLANLKYNASVYNIEALKWTQTSYVQPQMHPYDRLMWDPKLRAWTVEKYLADLRTRYGGIDSVLVWPTYTNIGCDDRNQFDMIRAMPGGIAGIRSLSSQLHAHGVKMLVPYHRWDQGTRRETCPSVQPGCNKTGQVMDDANAIAALLASANVDGFNGDAEPFVEKQFATAALARNHPLAFEPESETGQTPLAVIEWDTMSWGEHWGFQNGPPIVDAKKWLTRGAHNSNICSRWTHAIDTMIATSWFNGIGIESWENVWGSWAGKTPRAAHQIRVLGSMLRFAGGHTHGGDAQEDPPSNRSLLRSPLWLPYAPLMTTANQTQAQVYASTWPSDGELYLSTVIVADRSAALGNGTVKVTFELDSRVKGPGFHCYDAYRGRELAMPSGGGTMTVELDASCGGSNPAVESSVAGIGGLLFTTKTPASDSSLEVYLKRMQQLTARSTNMYTCEGGGHCYKKIGPAPPFEKNNGSPWPFYKTCTETHCAGLTQTMIPIAKTKLYASAPPGTVPVPGGSYLFTTRGAEIEGSPGVGVDFQFPWESEPGALFPDHAPHLLSMPPLFADKFPVTNADYAKYLLTSKYAPADKEHWLEKNFASDKKTVKPGWNRRPVTYVSLNDARAYCSYYGKRLPNVWDWQWVAGQAADMRIYPWSNEPPSNRTCPEVASGTGKNLTFDGPRDVDELDDCSSHGVCNLIGNVWQLTNEFEDQHTRSVLLKGGSNYRPAGSVWYLPQVRRLDLHQKYAG